MKLAFPACGYSSQNFEDILINANESGITALEVLINMDEISALDYKQSFITNLAKSTINISCLTSNTCLIDKESKSKTYQAIKNYIDFAVNLKVPYLQFMCDPNSSPQMDIDFDLLVDNLIFATDYASKNNITLLLETNGAFSDSHLLKDLLKIIASPQLGVLWNVHHPYRFCLESIGETYETLKRYIRYVHLSDSLMRDDGPEYCLLGKGDIPNQEALLILRDHNFEGYISWGDIYLLNKEIDFNTLLTHFINYI